MPSSRIQNGLIRRFVYRRQEWFWNGFFGFFFQPIGLQRNRERFVYEGNPLYAKLNEAAGQP